MPKKYLFALPFLFVAGISVAAEQKVDPPMITEPPIYELGGFGTLGISHSNLNQGDYVVDGSKPKGVGYSSDWWAGNNSKVAAHVTANFTPKVSAMLQIDSEYRTDGAYAPEIEWLNVKYAFTPNIHVRIGRIALPTFMDSENHDVGYTYVWITPPVELYRQLYIPGSDGIDVTYRFEIGDAGNTIKIIYGSNKLERPNSETISKDMWGLFDTFEYGPATFHISYQHRRTATTSYRTGLTGEWKQNSDFTVGASYDPGDWFVISEWMQRRSTTKIGAMYVSGGYRINKFTPFFAYSQNSPGSFYAYTTPPSTAARERADRSQRTISLGTRWDFMRNYDLKIQYDLVRLSNNSNGYLVNVQPGANLSGSKFYVISAVVDFVF